MVTTGQVHIDAKVICDILEISKYVFNNYFILPEPPVTNRITIKNQYQFIHWQYMYIHVTPIYINCDTN